LVTALHMSSMVRAAALTAVRASISTPVSPAHRASARMRTASSSTEKAMSRPVRATGWHMGISSCVRLAAMIPATWATASTSPLATPPVRISAAVAGAMWTVPSATAVRKVLALSVTYTIRARPWSPKWVSSMVLSSDPVHIPLRLAAAGLRHVVALRLGGNPRPDGPLQVQAVEAPEGDLPGGVEPGLEHTVRRHPDAVAPVTEPAAHGLDQPHQPPGPRPAVPPG